MPTIPTNLPTLTLAEMLVKQAQGIKFISLGISRTPLYIVECSPINSGNERREFIADNISKLKEEHPRTTHIVKENESFCSHEGLLIFSITLTPVIVASK